MNPSLIFPIEWQETPESFAKSLPPDSDLVVSPTDAANTATLGLVNIPATDGEAGRGELNNAATWDDFPNGRFGDFKSPAFGDQGPWGSMGISVRVYGLILIEQR